MQIRRLFQKANTLTPPIFADLLIETADGVIHVDVEQGGWLKDIQPLYQDALRIGLVMRGEKKPRVWLTVDGDKPRYFSRVIGKIDERGDRRIRVAGLQCDEVCVWLHRDGLVEVGPEPTYRE